MIKARARIRTYSFAASIFLLAAGFLLPVIAQTSADAVERGSRIAKNGFKNEDEIRDKFNNWKTDKDAQDWLVAMNYKVADIENVAAVKPHGEKADVEVRVRTKLGEKKEGISIKLVSSPTGFNQIDKRWLATYAKMWKMPVEVERDVETLCRRDCPDKTGTRPKTHVSERVPVRDSKGDCRFFCG